MQHGTSVQSANGGLYWWLVGAPGETGIIVFSDLH